MSEEERNLEKREQNLLYGFFFFSVQKKLWTQTNYLNNIPGSSSLQNLITHPINCKQQYKCDHQINPV